jgi:hypothetical protein
MLNAPIAQRLRDELPHPSEINGLTDLKALLGRTNPISTNEINHPARGAYTGRGCGGSRPLSSPVRLNQNPSREVEATSYDVL